MDRDKIVAAFNAFEKEKFTDSEDILRAEIKQAVNDHLKDTLGLDKDPIVSPESDDNTGDDEDE